MDDLRTRVYSRYVSSFTGKNTFNLLEIIKKRETYLKKIIVKHFPQHLDAEILDLGCGNGILIYCLQKYGYKNVNGVDISSEQVEAAHSLGIKGISCGDLLGYLRKCNDKTIDVVVTFDVIEHFKKEEIIEFIDEINRVLKDRGRWIIHTPNAESPLFGSVRYGDITHEIAFTRTSISQLLYSSGFSNVECFEDRPINKNTKGIIRLIVWIIFRNLLRVIVAAETGEINNEQIFSKNFLTVTYK